jgi:hypothetical protein
MNIVLFSSARVDRPLTMGLIIRRVAVSRQTGLRNPPASTSIGWPRPPVGFFNGKQRARRSGEGGLVESQAMEREEQGRVHTPNEKDDAK